MFEIDKQYTREFIHTACGGSGITSAQISRVPKLKRC